MELFFEEKTVDKDGTEVLSKTLLRSKEEATTLKTANDCYVHTCRHEEGLPCTRSRI